MPDRHLLFAVNEARPSGAPLSAVLTLEHVLRARFAQITVVVKRDGPLRPRFAAFADRVILQPVPLYPLLSKLRYRGVEVPGGIDRLMAGRVLDRWRPDAVYADTAVTAEYALLAHQRGLPTVLAVHELEPDLGRWARIHRWPTSQVGPSILANSHATAEAVRQRVPDGTSITILHPPVDVESLLRRSLPRVDGPPFVVVGVGRATTDKGVDVFVRVAAALRDLPVRWVWLGDGPDRARAAKLAERLGADVDLPGHADDVPATLGRASLCLIPSHQESLSRVAIEALALGVPVVASDVGGLPEAVGDAGVLVPREVGALAEAVRTLMDDESRRMALREAGPDRVRELFSIARYRQNAPAVLEQLTFL